jgi:hypothetical protein
MDGIIGSIGHSGLLQLLSRMFSLLALNSSDGLLRKMIEAGKESQSHVSHDGALEGTAFRVLGVN